MTTIYPPNDSGNINSAQEILVQKAEVLVKAYQEMTSKAQQSMRDGEFTDAKSQYQQCLNLLYELKAHTHLCLSVVNTVIDFTPPQLGDPR